jgi:hypothetical protein
MLSDLQDRLSRVKREVGDAWGDFQFDRAEKLYYLQVKLEKEIVKLMSQQKENKLNEEV